MEPIEIIAVDRSPHPCDGGGVLGHPTIYLTVTKGDTVECPYCGAKYTLRDGAKTGAHGH